jgi:hypothetical protein
MKAVVHLQKSQTRTNHFQCQLYHVTTNTHEALHPKVSSDGIGKEAVTERGPLFESCLRWP